MTDARRHVCGGLAGDGEGGLGQMVGLAGEGTGGWGGQPQLKIDHQLTEQFPKRICCKPEATGLWQGEVLLLQKK